jgi:AcrR family transcriptional regulator
MKNVDRRISATASILDGALDVLVEVGYARLRVADVAQRSGMSEGSLFRYFPTKNDLVRGALERSLAEHLDRLGVAFLAIDPKKMTRRKLLELLWDVLSHPEFVWTYELYVAAAHDPDLSSKLQSVFSAHSDNVNELAYSVLGDSGLLPKGEIRRATNLLTWSMQGLVMNDLARGTGFRNKELLDYLLFLAEAAYGKEPTRRS